MEPTPAPRSFAVPASCDLGPQIAALAQLGFDSPLLTELIRQATPSELDYAGPNARSALMLAAEQGNEEAINLLLDHGASLRSGTSHDACALKLACSRDQAGAAALLIARGADINDRESSMAPPLAYAALSGSASCARLLASLGADVNASTDDGLSILCNAIRTAARHELFAARTDAQAEGFIDSIQALLDAGADPYAKPAGGLSAAEQARVVGKPFEDLVLGHASRVQQRQMEESTPNGSQAPHPPLRI